MSCPILFPKSTLLVTVPLILMGLATSCSHSGDKACQYVHEVAAVTSPGMVDPRDYVEGMKLALSSAVESVSISSKADTERERLFASVALYGVSLYDWWAYDEAVFFLQAAADQGDESAAAHLAYISVLLDEPLQETGTRTERNLDAFITALSKGDPASAMECIEADLDIQDHLYSPDADDRSRRLLFYVKTAPRVLSAEDMQGVYDAAEALFIGQIRAPIRTDTGRVVPPADDFFAYLATFYLIGLEQAEEYEERNVLMDKLEALQGDAPDDLGIPSRVEAVLDTLGIEPHRGGGGRVLRLTS